MSAGEALRIGLLSLVIGNCGFPLFMHLTGTATMPSNGQIVGGALNPAKPTATNRRENRGFRSASSHSSRIHRRGR